MPRIDSRLLAATKKKLGGSTSNVYRLIEEKARAMRLPRHLAAIEVAADAGVNISKFVAPEHLAEVRAGRTGSSTNPAVVTQIETHLPSRRENSDARRRSLSKPKRRGNSVFVVHGRNEALRRALFGFLRSLGLQPIEWSKAIQLTRKPSPYVGEILDAAFREAVAVVVLLTPDDEAKLRDEFLKPHDPHYEKNLTGQARPNVLFEAGMAMGRSPNNVVLVQVGEMRPFSDIGGRHVVHLSNSVESRRELMTKLANAGCNVDADGSDWIKEGDFNL